MMKTKKLIQEALSLPVRERHISRRYLHHRANKKGRAMTGPALDLWCRQILGDYFTTFLMPAGAQLGFSSSHLIAFPGSNTMLL